MYEFILYFIVFLSIFRSLPFLISVFPLFLQFRIQNII
jgi:hypothetical protein